MSNLLHKIPTPSATEEKARHITAILLYKGIVKIEDVFECFCATQYELNGEIEAEDLIKFGNPNMPAPTDDMPIGPSGLVRPQAVVKDVPPPNDPA